MSDQPEAKLADVAPREDTKPTEPELKREEENNDVVSSSSSDVPPKGEQVDSEKNDFSDDDEEASHAPKLTDFKFIMVLIGFAMAFIGSQVPALLYSAVLPLIAEDLNATSLLVWFFSTQLIAVAVAVPFIGPLADMFGRKTVTITGILIGMVGMILVAATPNAAGYLAGQVLGGIGIAAQELSVISAVVEIVPNKYRGYYSALVMVSFFPFSPASLYGELISKHNWRYCGCMFAIWNFLTAIILFFFYNPPARSNGAGLTMLQKWKRIDVGGGLLMTAGLIFFLVGFNWGGETHPWHSSWVISFLTVGLFLLLVFVLYECFVAPYPMFPRRLWRHPRTFIALMVLTLLAGVNWISILEFWVLEAVAIFDSDQTQLGIRTLPYGFCLVGGAIISAVMISAWKGHVRSIMVGWGIVQAVAISCMLVIDPYNIATVYPSLIVGLTAIGGVIIPNQIIVTFICPDDLIGTATALTICVRGIGQVIGTSVFYTQFVSTLTTNTVSRVVPVCIENGITDVTLLESMMGELLSIPWKEFATMVPQLADPKVNQIVHDAVISAFMAAFNRVWYIFIAFGVAAVLASLAIEDMSKLQNGHIAVHYF